MNIVVYGFMGVGKTTVGELLAQNLGYEFIDMDNEIEKRERATINEIFQIYGESKFRKLESMLVKELSEKDKVVISCGGGVIINKDNAETLSRNSWMIHLTASIGEIIERTKFDKNRPLLKVNNRLNTVSELYELRKPIYHKYADITIDTTGKNPVKIVEMVLEAIK